MLHSRTPLLFVVVVLCLLETQVASLTAFPPKRETIPEKSSLPPGAVARLGSLRLRHEQVVDSLAFSPDGEQVASVDRYNSEIRVWEVATGKLMHRVDATGIFSRKSFAPFVPEDYNLAFTPDGTSIAAGVGADVCFWELKSGRKVRRFRGKSREILALTFSHDKRTFYCGGADNKLYQWDIVTGKQLKCWDYFEGNQPKIYASGFAERTAYLRAISADGKTAVWLVRHWRGNKNGVSSKSGDLTVWDVRTRKDRCRITDKNGDNFHTPHVALSGDGKYLTAYTRNSELMVWSTQTGKGMNTFGSGEFVESCTYSSDGRLLAAMTRGNNLTVWELASGKKLWCNKISPGYISNWSNGQALAFSPDGKTLAVGVGNNIQLWNVESGKEFPVLQGHRWSVDTLVFLPKSQTLISGDAMSVCEWENSRQMKRFSMPAFSAHTRSIAESYEAKLRISQPEGRHPQLRDLITNKLLCEFQDVKGSYYHGCFSADGRTVALRRTDKKQEIIVIDIPSRKVRSRFFPNGSMSENLVLSRTGKWLALLCEDQTIAVIDSVSGKTVRKFGNPQKLLDNTSPRTKLTVGVFSSDGQFLAFGTEIERPRDYWRMRFGNISDLTPDPPGIRVWHVATGQELRQFKNCMKNAPHGIIASLRFSPDNRNLAVALNFNPWQPDDWEQAAVRVLEVASGKLRRKFKGHTDQVASVAFSPDGKILASGSWDSTILLWDMNRPVATVPLVRTLKAKQLEHHWNTLASSDGIAAFDSVLALSKISAPSVPFFAKRLNRVEKVAKEQILKWIADLKERSFKVREEAYAKLVLQHELARPSLEEALGSKLLLESQRRINRLVKALDYSPTLVRSLRSVEVLERIASKDARRLLRKLAGGASGAILTLEAKAALARLKSLH